MIRVLYLLLLSASFAAVLAPTPGWGQSRTAPQGYETRSPSATPGQRAAQPGRWDGRSAAGPPGTELPSAAEPAPPSSPSPSASGSSARTSDGPSMPGDPAQAPIGGLGWLVAAGAGYGAYRLRQGTDEKGDGGSGFPVRG